MSAQDDVLAAFGEPPSRTRAEAAGDAKADGALSDSVLTDGALTDGVLSDSVLTDGALTDGALTDGVLTDGALTDDAEAAVEKQAESDASEQAAEADHAEAEDHAEVPASASTTADAEAVAEAAATQQPAEPSGFSTPGSAAASGLPAEPSPGTPEPITSPPAATVQAPFPAQGAAAQPYLDPAAFFAQLQAEAAPKPKRRWPRLLLRYGSALVVAGAVGAGTAYAITVPRRTDVPFLATPSDGRYSFLNVVHPVPPAGKPAPGADSNQAQIHYGDLRQYLVPAPVGAVSKENGWESVADFEKSLSGSDVSNHLYDAGIRRVAWRGWTASDGQHTLVELVQFPDHQAAYTVANLLDGASPAKAGRPENVVPELTVPGFGDATSSSAIRKFDQVAGLPGQMERRVVLQSGDVVAIVTSTAPDKVPDTPTIQVALLEAGMLF